MTSEPYVVEDDELEREPTVITDGGERRFGRYQLCFEIASGGMATVYLARAEGPAGFEKLVALKRIHPHLAKHRSFVEMFLDEARIAASISHPNVCSVFDFGEEDDTYFLAMEYLVGEPLARVLPQVARDPIYRTTKYPPLIARILADACEGLHAVHELKDKNGESLNVVHRDVSPQNVFVTYDGAVSIVDFGIASARGRVHETSSGAVKGKFAYMSPQQVKGAKVDRRSDIWSMGVVLWEMLVMKRLFRRDTESETIFAVASEPVPPPSSVRAWIDPALDAIVLKALSRDPEQRYQTMRELGRDLLRFLGNQDEPVAPGDVAEWMQELFPGRRAAKVQLLEIARQPEVRVPQVHDAQEVSGQSIGTPVQSHVRELHTPPWIWAALGATSVIAVLAVVALAWVLVRPGEDAVTSTPLPPDTTASRPAEPAAVAARGAEPPAPSPMVEPVAEDPGTSMDEPEPAAPRVAPDPPAPPDMEVARPPRPDPRPPPSAPEPADRGTGFVNLVTPGGWAVVQHRGRRVGQTPGRIELPSGRQTIDLLPFGEGPPRRVRVTVERGQTRRMSVPLR